MGLAAPGQVGSWQLESKVTKFCIVFLNVLGIASVLSYSYKLTRRYSHLATRVTNFGPKQMKVGISQSMAYGPATIIFMHGSLVLLESTDLFLPLE